MERNKLQVSPVSAGGLDEANGITSSAKRKGAILS